jgi:hypothetical protein
MSSPILQQTLVTHHINKRSVKDKRTSCGTIIQNSVHENPPADFQLTGKNAGI